MSKYQWNQIDTAQVDEFDKSMVGKVLGGYCQHGLWARDVTEQPHDHCGWAVGGDFAPGHDAKLKGMLIQAGIDGLTHVMRSDRIANGTVTVTTVTLARADDPTKTRTKVKRVYGWDWKSSLVSIEDAANRYGFAWQVSAGIERGKARAEKAALRIKDNAVDSQRAQVRARRATKTEVQTETPHTEQQGQVKVGRWWYDISTGQTGDNGGVLYIAKDGSIKEAKPGSETR